MQSRWDIVWLMIILDNVVHFVGLDSVEITLPETYCSSINSVLEPCCYLVNQLLYTSQSLVFTAS